MSFNFMAAVTICSDFGAQDNKVCHCFHCFPIYLPLSNGTGCHDLITGGFFVFFFLNLVVLAGGNFKLLKVIFSSLL